MSQGNDLPVRSDYTRRSAEQVLKDLNSAWDRIKSLEGKLQRERIINRVLSTVITAALTAAFLSLFKLLLGL